MGDEESFEDAIKSEKFEAVVDVLNALQEHDEELVDIIRELKERKGLGEPFNPRRLSDKIEVIGPRVNLVRLTTSISVEIADRIGSNWDEWYGLLLLFKAREGHCLVPRDHIEGAFKLGQWVCIAAYGFLIAEQATIPPSETRSAAPVQVPPLPDNYRPRGSALAA